MPGYKIRRFTVTIGFPQTILIQVPTNPRFICLIDIHIVIEGEPSQRSWPSLQNAHSLHDIMYPVTARNTYAHPLRLIACPFLGKTSLYNTLRNPPHGRKRLELQQRSRIMGRVSLQWNGVIVDEKSRDALAMIWDHAETALAQRNIAGKRILGSRVLGGRLKWRALGDGPRSASGQDGGVEVTSSSSVSLSRAQHLVPNELSITLWAFAGLPFQTTTWRSSMPPGNPASAFVIQIRRSALVSPLRTRW